MNAQVCELGWDLGRRGTLGNRKRLNGDWGIHIGRVEAMC